MLVPWRVVLFVKECLGGGFEYVLFSPLPGEMIQFDQYFSGGLKPPTRCVFWGKCNEK